MSLLANRPLGPKVAEFESQFLYGEAVQLRASHSIRYAAQYARLMHYHRVPR